jgi:hypothetical protein
MFYLSFVLWGLLREVVHEQVSHYIRQETAAISMDGRPFTAPFVRDKVSSGQEYLPTPQVFRPKFCMPFYRFIVATCSAQLIQPQILHSGNL